MRDYYLGCDPGKKGFICLYNVGYSGYKHYPLFDGNRLNREMLRTLEKLAQTYTIMAVVEQVHSMPHQGVASTFSFGTNYGMVIGALEALGIPYCTVTPGRWQKFICEAVDKAPNTKQMHYNAARRLQTKSSKALSTRLVSGWKSNAYLYVDDIDQLHESALIGDFRKCMED